jgi:putative transposase
MDWRLRSGRRPLLNEPGHAHELTFCCHRRFRFLQSDQTCQWLADALDQSRQELQFCVWAYVLMPEHVHLIVFPQQERYDISTILNAIKQPVARTAVRYLSVHAPAWLPKITVQRGRRQERRFWQAGGGFDRNVFEPETLFAMIDYIHANPVRRGLVERAEDWKWSSAGWREGKNTLRPDVIETGGLNPFYGGKA